MTETNPIVVRPWTPHAGYRTETKDGETPIALQTPEETAISPPSSPFEKIPKPPTSDTPLWTPNVPPPVTQPPVSPPPISSDPLPPVPPPSTTTVKPPPSPIFKETDKGTIITNLAEVKAYNRQYNDAVDALAPYKVGNSYNLTQAIIKGDTKAEDAALLLMPDLKRSDFDDIRTEIAEYEAKQKELNQQYLEQQKQAIDTEIKEVTASEYAKMTPEQRKYAVPNLSTWEYLTPWSEEKGETFGPWAKSTAMTAVEILVPVVYTAKNWGTMSTGWKVASIAMDLAVLIPVVGFGVRGTAASVRAGATLPRALGTAAMAEIKAPYTMIRHPLSTLKSIPPTIKESTRVFYAPFETVMQSHKGMKAFWSDVRLVAGMGGEVSSETLHAMQQLTRATVAGTTGEYRVGLNMARLDPVDIIKVGKLPSTVHSSPLSNKLLLQAKDTGYITPLGDGFYAAAGGTDFVYNSAHGLQGPMPAFNVFDLPSGVKRVPERFERILHDEGFRAYEDAIERAVRSGELAPGPYAGTYVYQNTAEQELRIIGQAGKDMPIYPVKTGKETTFRWIVPDEKIMNQALTIRKQAQTKINELTKAEGLGNRREARGISKELDNLIKEADRLEKEAYRLGKAESVTLDIDHLKTIDPLSGRESYVFHWSLKPNTKPWTFRQKANLKIKGFIEIPKSIFVPDLKLPKLTPEQQIKMVASELKPAEAERFMAGLQVLDELLPIKIPSNVSNKWRVDLSVVKNMPSQELARGLEKYVSARGHRIGGSLVDYVQTGNKALPGISVPKDIDIVVTRNHAKSVDEIYELVKSYVGKSDVRRVKNAIEIRKNGKWVEFIDVVNDTPKTPQTLVKVARNDAFGYAPAKPIMTKTVNGLPIQMDSIAEQLRRRGAFVLMFPGWGVEAGKIGPVAAAKFSRLKDIARFEADARYYIDLLRNGGQYKKAKDVERALNKLLGLPDNTTGLGSQISKSEINRLENVSKKAKDKLDDIFNPEGLTPKELLAKHEAEIRLERRIAKAIGMPYVERQVAVAGAGRILTGATRYGVRLKDGSSGRTASVGRIKISDDSVYRLDTTRRTSNDRPSTRIRVPDEDGGRYRPPDDSRPPDRYEPPRVPDRPPRIPDRPPDRSRPPDRGKPPDKGKPPRKPDTPAIPVPSLKRDKSKRRFPMDSFAWKQGFGWWVSMPPYSGTIGKDMIFTRTKPAGVPIGRTPKETVTKLGINVPKGNIVDLGIMDVHLGNKGKNIKYTKDRRQKTKQGKVIGMPPGIVGARGR